MEISRRVAEQLRQMKRQIDSLEARLRALTFNTSATDSHYLVEAPVDGIPAFVDPIPGMANCNIVRRFSNDTDEDKELAVSTSKERVYNLGLAIEAGEYAVAHRDAFGDLFIEAGGNEDPDTPFRQTVETSIASLTRGHTAPIFGDAADLTFDALNLHSQGGGASTANGASHGLAVSAGTLGFFNENTGATTPILKKTSDGGFAPAIIYMLNENHKYAVCDSRLAQPADQRFLISTPYGPYRIISYNDLDPEVTEFPKFVYASIKDQTQDRDVSFYFASIYEKESGGEYTVRFPSSQEQSSAANDASRMVFPELLLQGTAKNRITRRDYTDKAPHPIYIFRIMLHGLARRSTVDTYTSEDLFTLEQVGGGSAVVRSYHPLRYRLRAFFKLTDDSENTQDSDFFLAETHAFKISGVSELDAQTWSVSMVGYLPEYYKELRFEIQPNWVGGSASYPDVSLTSDTGAGISSVGSIMLWRCGDRGAHPNAGSRTLSGFETVVSEPEPP